MKGADRKGTLCAAGSLMSLKKSSNSIGPCDRLLQEPITQNFMDISQTLPVKYGHWLSHIRQNRLLCPFSYWSEFFMQRIKNPDQSVNLAEVFI